MVGGAYVGFAAARLVAEIFQPREQALGFALAERAEPRKDRQPGNVQDVSVSV